MDWKKLDDLIPKNFKDNKKFKKTGVAGIFAGSLELVKEGNLEIKQKEYVSILGSSGSGKSTLMYLIGLLETPTTGKIFLDNKDVSTLTDDELSQIRNHYVGFVFQSFNLINKFFKIIFMFS